MSVGWGQNEGDIIITEFFFNKSAGNLPEYVELFNKTESTINLEYWKLDIDGIQVEIDTTFNIAPQDYVVILSSNGVFRSEDGTTYCSFHYDFPFHFCDVPVDELFWSLNPFSDLPNSSGSIKIWDNSSTPIVIDSVAYSAETNFPVGDDIFGMAAEFIQNPLLDSSHILNDNGENWQSSLNPSEWLWNGTSHDYGSPLSVGLYSFGCTHPNATNYDETANVDDGSCEFSGDYSLSFDGDAYVQLPLENDNLLSGTISVRVKFNSVSFSDGHTGIYSVGSSPFSDGSYSLLGIHTGVDYNLRFGLYDANGWHWVDSEISPLANPTYYIAASWGSDSLKIYINGELKNISNFTGGMPSNYNHFVGSGGDINSGINGNIDELHVWNIALDSNQIQQYMDYLPMGNEEGLVAYYKFNAGSGNTLYDHSGNGNHGTINGATWVENIYGCTDSYADNYNSDANWDDGSCTYPGCIDPEACNYNPLATVDDDSCAELDPCGVCDGQAECLVLDSDLFGTWQNESNLYYSNSDCSGEGEVMGSDFDDVPDQIEINSDGTMVQMELFEDNICSDVSDCPEMEYMTCLEDGYCASVVYSQWGINEDTSEFWIIYESQYASVSYSLDSNGNMIVNSDGNSDGIECANNDIECCWNFIFNPIIDYTLDLDAGANLKSFYALPEDVSVKNIMSSLGDDVTGVITEGGACSQITPGNWVGSQCNLLPEKGYWIIVTTDDDLPVFDAVPTDPTLEYTLHAGANLISFPSADTVAVPDALPDDIELAVSGVITEGGACSQITQGTWVGSQCSFIGGKGYWMIISTGISFSYDFSTLGRTNIAYKQEKLSGYEYTQSSKQAFYFIESIENIEIGDWILTYNGDKLIGSKQWQGSIIDVPAMGNDGNSYSDGYLEAGATPQFKLLSGGKLINLEGEVPAWSDNGLFMVSSLTQVIVPEVYSLSQAYPNPFNPVTTLSFAIPIDSEVSLSVYNLQGREVSTLISGYMDAGYHSVVWNADNYSSGIYFVQMIAGDYNHTQKLMLVK